MVWTSDQNDTNILVKYIGYSRIDFIMELEKSYDKVKQIILEKDEGSLEKMWTEERNSMTSDEVAEIIFVNFELPVDDGLEVHLLREINQNLPTWRLYDEDGVFSADDGYGVISISRDVPAEDVSRLTELDKSDTFDK